MTNMKPGDFIWYDLLTTDAEACVSFYGHVLGWTAAPFNDSYTVFSNAEGPLGGVTVTPGERPHWLSNVLVIDVEKTVAEATRLGGRLLLDPVAIPGIGRFATIGDPDGVPINVLSLLRPITEHDRRRHGSFTWHELISVEHERAFAFYNALFGWKKSKDFPLGPLGNYLLYGNGGSDLGGMFTKPKEAPAATWMYYIEVKDLSAALTRAKEGGAKVLVGPMEVPGGAHMVQLADPQGAMFALHEEAKQ
jgi:uncharacterized protein